MRISRVVTGILLVSAMTASAHAQSFRRRADAERDGSPGPGGPRHEVGLNAVATVGPDLRFSHALATRDLLPNSPVRVSGVPVHLDLNYHYLLSLGHGLHLSLGPELMAGRLQLGTSDRWSLAGTTEEITFDAFDVGLFAIAGVEWRFGPGWFVRGDVGIGFLSSAVDAEFEGRLTSPAATGRTSGSESGILPAMPLNVTVGIRFRSWWSPRLMNSVHVQVGYLWADALTVEFDDQIIVTPGGTVPYDWGRMHYRPGGITIKFGTTIAW